MLIFEIFFYYVEDTSAKWVFYIYDNIVLRTLFHGFCPVILILVWRIVFLSINYYMPLAPVRLFLRFIIEEMLMLLPLRTLLSTFIDMINQLLISEKSVWIARHMPMHFEQPSVRIQMLSL